jgi:hypothetical protein
VLDHQERDQRGRPSPQQAERLGRPPSVLGRARERERDGAGGDREGEDAGDVDATALRALLARQHAPADGDRNHADRQVDEEDPAPRQALREDAAEDRPGGGRRAVDSAPDAEGHPAIAALVGGADERDVRREHRGGPDALHATGGDQDGRRARQPRGQRGGGEDDQAADVDRLAADEIRERPGSEQQRREGEGVDVDHPLQLRERRVQIGGHVGQGHVHDRHVDEEHERSEADRHEWEPFAHGASVPPRQLQHQKNGP